MPVKVPSPAEQLAAMDELDVEVAITSLTPRVLSAHPGQARDVARACKGFQAGLVRDHPGRFGALALLPLPDLDAALEEVEFALDQLQLDGVGLYSSSEGRYLGDPLYEPLFEELNRRQAVVFVHPAHCEAPPELNLQAPPALIEYIFDTTRAIVNLLYTRTLERYPDVRLIFSHAGGAVPFLTRRISGLQYSSRIADVVGTLHKLYYDVASAMSDYALPSLQALAKPDHILFGTDYPFIHGPRLRAHIQEWEAYKGFDAASLRDIEHGNALRLFPSVAARSLV
jgi:predicted TIM-barrel fold metal-dependent hydrolase